MSHEIRGIEGGCGLHLYESHTQDDPDALDFVVAAANLRALNYRILPKSRFDVKCEGNGKKFFLHQTVLAH